MKKLGNKQRCAFEISNTIHIVIPIIICTSIDMTKIHENLKIQNAFEKGKRRFGNK